MKHFSFTTFFCVFLLISPHLTYAQPSGFIDEIISTDWNVPVGLTFDNNGRMFVWEKAGRVYIVENGNKSLFIDLTAEVLDFNDHGLNGFTLDPSFASNGYVYLMFVAKRCYVLGQDCENHTYTTTIGRIVRYTAIFDENGFPTIDVNSRIVLVGETISTGIPILVDAHGVGSLVFGADGTLLISVGDAAIASLPLEDETINPFFQDAVNVGILDNSQLVGVYRSQLLNSLNGKILRIDPATGDGLVSNPFSDSTNLRSAQSRIWTYGMRNPFRFSVKPGTGSNNPTDGNPGTLYVGDVGWFNREEINIIDAGGKNGGWPKNEGINHINTNFQDSAYDFSNHHRPIIDWRGPVAQAYVNGDVYSIGSPQFMGEAFTGNSSIGGLFYTGTSFPAKYQDMYFQGDYSGWIKGFHFHIDEIHVESFVDGIHPTSLAINPVDGSIYYTNYIYDAINPVQEVRKLVYDSTANRPPVAVILATPIYGGNPVEVSFDGSQSSDPENGSLAYEWDFGDGSLISNEPNPVHLYFALTNAPESFTARLTVTDSLGKTSTKTILIYLNNSPPVIDSTSIETISCFLNIAPLKINLDALITDAEHDSSQLNYQWLVILIHDDHTHLQTIVNALQGEAILEPVANDGQLYYYEISLKVTDNAGLSTTFSKYIYPLQPNFDLVDPTNFITSGANRSYFAGMSITGSNTIQTNATVEYKAVNSIILNPGFHAESGSVFKAQIEGCSN